MLYEPYAYEKSGYISVLFGDFYRNAESTTL